MNILEAEMGHTSGVTSSVMSACFYRNDPLERRWISFTSLSCNRHLCS